MKEHDHYMSTQCKRVVINIGEDTSESDYDSSTETASMGSSTDTASEIDWIDLLFLYAQWKDNKICMKQKIIIKMKK